MVLADGIAPVGVGVCVPPQAIRKKMRQSEVVPIKQEEEVLKFTATTPREMKPRPRLLIARAHQEMVEGDCL